MSRTPRTSLRSALARLAITAAAGALVTAAATMPAVADEDWGQDQGSDSAAAPFDEGGGDGGDGGWGQEGQQGQNQGQELGQEQGREQSQEQGREQEQSHGQRNARGVVTARELLLRSAPSRGGQVIRVVHRGEVVSIYCQTRGQSVEGNPVWYLLPDGTWAWGPARFIDVIGPAPRWC